ncbi:hypothetical protein ACFX13_019234 [Malus domestica]
MQSLTEILVASQGMKQPTCAIFGVTGIAEKSSNSTAFSASAGGIAEKSSNSTAFSASAGVWFLCEVRREGGQVALLVLLIGEVKQVVQGLQKVGIKPHVPQAHTLVHHLHTRDKDDQIQNSFDSCLCGMFFTCSVEMEIDCFFP